MKISSLFIAVLVLLLTPGLVWAAIRGDFNNDGSVTLADYGLLIPRLHTTNTTYSLAGTNGYVDLFDVNEFFKLLVSGGYPEGVMVPYELVNRPIVAGSSRKACKPSETKSQESQLNIATINIGTKQTNYTKPSWQTLVKNHNIDVLLLQEINSTSSYAYRALVNPGGPFADWSFVFQDHGANGGYGNMIISRFPLSDIKVKALNLSEEQVRGLCPDGKWGIYCKQRMIVSAIVTTPAGKVRVYNHHSRSNAPCKQSADAIRFMMESSNDVGEVIVMGGDFNRSYSNINGGGDKPCTGSGANAFPEQLPREQCRGCDWSTSRDILFAPLRSDKRFESICTAADEPVRELRDTTEHVLIKGTISVL